MTSVQRDDKGSTTDAEIKSAIVSSAGRTRLQAALERAQKGGPPCIGQWMELPGYSLARTIAGLGFDWVLVDCEHGNIDDSEMYLAVAAIASAGSSPIVRVAGSEPWMMKRALDAGAHAIMIPMCETKQQAQGIVRAMRYPTSQWPKGIRGTGAMFAPANFNQNGMEYLKRANDNILVIVQIETRTAVENCEEIASTDGIDMLFVGPNDLAASMGYFAFDHAKITEVQEATARVLEAAKGAGKFAGHFALSADIAAQKSRDGWDFMNCGADIVAVTSWMETEKAKLKHLLSKK